MKKTFSLLSIFSLILICLTPASGNDYLKDEKIKEVSLENILVSSNINSDQELSLEELSLEELSVFDCQTACYFAKVECLALCISRKCRRNCDILYYICVIACMALE